MIAPGLFDPSEPIVFGGSSIEAAVREALHDPSRQSIARDALHAMTETDPRAAPLLDMDDSMIQEEQAVEEIPSRIATDATHVSPSLDYRKRLCLRISPFSIRQSISLPSNVRIANRHVKR